MRTLDPHIKYIVGIDEAGRGPVAGPVAVGVVVLPIARAEETQFRDSKKLAQHKREIVFSEMREREWKRELSFSVAMTSAGRIDAIGINRAVGDAMRRALRRLKVDPNECLVLLDGGLRAPKEFFYQETIIKGDEKEYAIALASIAAKVMRDEKMRRMSYRYPQYGFDRHKGYGTHDHYKSIKKNGVTTMHRRSFLTRLH